MQLMLKQEKIFGFTILKFQKFGRKKACCDVVNRGAAVWKGFVFLATLDGRLLKLKAKSGEVVWEINTIIDRELDYTITGAPRIANNKIFIGNGGADMGGVRGYVFSL